MESILNVLILGGSSVRYTLSQVKILEKILDRINHDCPELPEFRAIADVFRVMVANGPSSFVIFLFALRATPADVAKELSILLQDVFDCDDLSPNERTWRLEQHVYRMLDSYNLPRDTTLRQLAELKNTPLLIFGCSLTRDLASFRSLSTRALSGAPSYCDTTVAHALLATSASVPWFTPVSIGAGNLSEEHISSTNIYPNPIKIIHLLRTTFGDEIRLSSIVILGSGALPAIEHNAPPTMVYRGIEEAGIEDFHRLHLGTSRCFHFTVEPGMVRYDGSPAPDLPTIISHTVRYLEKPVVEKQLELLGAAMGGQLRAPMPTLGSLANPFPALERTKPAAFPCCKDVTKWAEDPGASPRILIVTDIPAATNASIRGHLIGHLKKYLAFDYSFPQGASEPSTPRNLCYQVNPKVCSKFVHLRPSLRAIMPHLPFIREHDLRMNWEMLVVDPLRRLDRPLVILENLEECNAVDQADFTSLLLETFGPNAILPKSKVIIIARSVTSPVVAALLRSPHAGTLTPALPAATDPGCSAHDNNTQPEPLLNHSSRVEVCRALNCRGSIHLKQAYAAAFTVAPHDPAFCNTPINRVLRRIFMASTPRITMSTFSPVGDSVFTGHVDRNIRLWTPGSLLPETFSGHTGRITVISPAPYGSRFASGSADNSVRIWHKDAASVRCEVMTGHRDQVSCLDWSPSGEYLVSGSMDHTLRLWNTQRGDKIGKEISDDLGPITSVKFMSNGSHFACSSSTGDLAVFSAPKCELQARVALSIVIHQIAWDNGRLLAVLEDGTVQVWTLDVDRRILTLISTIKHPPIDPHHSLVTSSPTSIVAPASCYPG
ncbi:SubName: Full=Uncharacterized protein {ECO:0000313/EMBL:CCA69754.1} [Serendipita indica DSM 11827]|nr:SubName: Full=Uncharacterized protein {ECO:0000313/EMBL:CCA69754.1} [Serendipita indica DSM 11827]